MPAVAALRTSPLPCTHACVRPLACAWLQILQGVANDWTLCLCPYSKKKTPSARKPREAKEGVTKPPASDMFAKLAAAKK